MKFNFKKVTVLVMAAIMASSAFAGPVADAAKGGAKLSAPKVSAPAKPAPAANSNSTTKTEQKAGPNQQEYAPSKKADQHSDTAPAAKNNANANANNAAAANTANTGSRWGSALRTVGLLAGGMMLGSLLGSMFGFGEGLLADILGLVANIAMFMLAFMAIKWIWNKFRGNSNDRNYARPGQETIDVKPQYSTPVQDIKPPTASPVQDIKPPASMSAMGSTRTNGDLNGVTGYEYSADRAADRYRKL